MTPEGKVKKNIKKFMADLFKNAWSYMPVQTGYGQSGIPDHIYCVPMLITADMVGETVGVFVGIEAKTAQGKMTAYQRVQRDLIIDAGGFYATIYGSDEIENKLQHFRGFKQ